MALGTEVGLGRRDIVLGVGWRPSSPPLKGHSHCPSNFRPKSVVAELVRDGPNTSLSLYEFGPDALSGSRDISYAETKKTK